MVFSAHQTSMISHKSHAPKGFLGWLLLVVEFSRAKLVSAVTLSGAMGYFLFSGQVDWLVGLLVLGIFFLGCGCSALNQIQEGKTDALMERTKNRPIPSGQLDVATGWFITLLLLFLGLYCLASIKTHMVVILFLAGFTLIWYNGVYTYLKSVTALAVIPGAVLGAIPPVMGCAAAGGVWWDMNILMVAGYFFVWQIPHFWLLMLMRGKEYEEAGLRSMTQLFSARQFYRIIFVWLFAAAAMGFYVALFRSTHWIWLSGILLSSIWLVLKSTFLLKASPDPSRFRPAFYNCIIYNVLVMLFLSIDALLK
jgi:protoheme IX farnesyltransferase